MRLPGSNVSFGIGLLIPRKNAGFTLVELIVVITILAILGTIGFVSIQGYSSSARDSLRIGNLINLQKGLNVFQIKSGIYPLPENPVSITASGSTIGYQGFAKDLVEAIAGLSKGGTIDPMDTSIYTTYSVNANQSKMQLMTFLENGSNVTAFIPDAYAGVGSDYSKRSPMTKGDPLGILIASGSLQPIQESGTELDVVLTNTGYIAVFGKGKSLSGTGVVLSQVNTNYDCKRIFETGVGAKDGIYKISPRGISLDAYCTMKQPTTTFYNYIMDGDFEDPSGNNWIPSLKSAQSSLTGNYGLGITGYLQFNSNNYTYVDSSKNYTLEGYFKSSGINNSRMYYGFIEFDKDFNIIGNKEVNTVLGTESVLLQDVISTDTSVIFSNSGGTICNNWQNGGSFLNYASIAFNIDDSGEYNDLPNRNLSSRGFNSIVNNGNSCTLNLKNPVGLSYASGTKIRMHSDGSSYNYVAATGSIVPNTWTKYEGAVSGMSKFGVSTSKFRRGTQYVRPLIIANYQQDSQSKLNVDDLNMVVY